MNGHPKYQMGWHQSVVLDEKWWKNNKITEILKGAKWRYLSKTPECLVHENWCQWVSLPLGHHLKGRGRRSPSLLKQRVLKLCGRKEIRVSGWNSLELEAAVSSKASLHQRGQSWQSWGLPALSCKAPGTAGTWCLLWAFPAHFLWWWIFSWSAMLPVPVLRCIREQPTVGKCLLRDITRVEHPLKCCKHHRQLFGAFLIVYCRTVTQGKLFWLFKGLQPVHSVVFFMWHWCLQKYVEAALPSAKEER